MIRQDAVAPVSLVRKRCFRYDNSRSQRIRLLQSYGVQIVFGTALLAQIGLLIPVMPILMVAGAMGTSTPHFVAFSVSTRGTSTIKSMRQPGCRHIGAVVRTLLLTMP